MTVSGKGIASFLDDPGNTRVVRHHERCKQRRHGAKPTPLVPCQQTDFLSSLGDQLIGGKQAKAHLPAFGFIEASEKVGVKLDSPIRNSQTVARQYPVDCPALALAERRRDDELKPQAVENIGGVIADFYGSENGYRVLPGGIIDGADDIGEDRYGWLHLDFLHLRFIVIADVH
ncbi:hypothetical protein ACK6D9_02960 [Hoeflea sp. Naph1]|uniref:hypothetical protein n=1 Tax=Hoeflea sp. Naph1 TaxID=3388653 RepID=UPI00398FCAE0